MKIILIEDDQFFQKFYASKLAENGYTVETASDGEEGLKKLQAGDYDLILLDLVMPKMNGFQLLQAKSENKQLAKIPVIVFSTLGQNEDIERAKQLGATDYMSKTFINFNELLTKIKQVTG